MTNWGGGSWGGLSGGSGGGGSWGGGSGGGGTGGGWGGGSGGSGGGGTGGGGGTTTPNSPTPFPNAGADPGGISPMDLFSINAAVRSAPAGGPFYIYKVFDFPPDERGRKRGYALVGFYDGRGGRNKQVGDYNRDFDRTSEGDAYVMFQRHLTHPLLSTQQTTPDPAGTITGIHHANIFGTLIIAAGATDDACLFKETSATDPTIVAITGAGTGGRPGASFTCAHPAIFNGAGTARKLVLGLVGAAPIAITAADGTLHGTTAHTSLNPLWGLIQTFTNDNLILFYADDGIYTLAQANNWDTAPTLQTAMRGGGFALGLHQVGGAPIRAYWAEPREHLATGILATGADFDVVSTNVEGLEKVPMNFAPFLDGLRWACIYRDGIIASDHNRVVFNNGANIIDLGIFNDPPANSDKVYKARAAWVHGSTLKVLVERKASASGTGNTQTAVWEFDFPNFAWQQTSKWLTQSTTGDLAKLPSGSLPWSKATEYLHRYSDGEWVRQQFMQPGVNPFTKRKTAGAQSGTGYAFEETADWTSPAFELPGLEGYGKYVGGFVFLGDLEAGQQSTGSVTTGAYVDISAGGVTRRFEANHALTAGTAKRVKMADGQVTYFDKLQVTVASHRQTGGTDPTRFTPNIFPFQVIVYWMEPGAVIPPELLPIPPHLGVSEL